MKKGFTLVELAIVLVIIGLLVGGVLTGQELIFQAKISKTISQIADLNRATNTFQAKYGQLPGDFDRATSIWGLNGSTCFNFPKEDVETCDGDGDGAIWSSGSGTFEYQTYWRHLRNSGLIADFQVTDIGGVVAGFEESFLETPFGFTGNASTGGYGDGMLGITVGASAYFQMIFSSASGHFFAIGENVDDADVSLGTTMIPEIAYSIDNKLDDGRPGTGSVFPDTTYLGATKCKDGSSPPNYDITDDSNYCALIVKANF